MDATAQDNRWIGLNSPDGVITRKGTINIKGPWPTTGYGYSLTGESLTNLNEWGTPHYGLFLGSASNGVNLSFSQASGANPIIMSGFYGLGFKTYKGSMVLTERGHVVIGEGDLDDSLMENLAANPNTDYRLYVTKGIRSESVKVDLKSNWPDYVFKSDYDLLPLDDVRDFIGKNNHLPNVPSEKEVEENGIDLAEMDATLLRKIEEMTLYILELNDKIKSLEKELSEVVDGTESK